ncbi:MAG: helix-hairpin-helix domain-containing protein, partial [Kiloniellales bacterium]|nr:helix-hairpin-helix domain-containing protein [Kiloniellales bacterium]
HLLVAEGFTTLEQVAFVPIQELAEIEGFDEEVAEELRARGRAFLEEQDRQFEEERRKLGVSDDLAALDGVSPSMLVQFGQNGIKTLDDLGDLASDELIELLGEGAPPPELADKIIMAARAHWFEGEEGAEPAEEEVEDADAPDGEPDGAEEATSGAPEPAPESSPEAGATEKSGPAEV